MPNKSKILWIFFNTLFVFLFILFTIFAFLDPNPINILLAIFIGIIEFIGIIIPVYEFYFKKPQVKLDLEDSREDLIRIYKTQSWLQYSRQNELPRTDVRLSESDPPSYGEHSKYIRIKLINEGKKVAEN